MAPLLSIANFFRQIFKVSIDASVDYLLVSILKTIGAIEPTKVSICLVSLFNIPACCSYIDVRNTPQNIKHPLLVGNMFLDRFSACYRCSFQDGIGLHGKEIGRVQTIGRGCYAAQQRRSNYC
ncbi:hypothetical protein [Shinella fusca]|uniref:Uncharacterized protein n=1 Tax=Shinella fusca TaxID=544480 RepID=A0A7W7YWD3_9HYPH|nr:hypothetical protein [Shinella fusca]MBB5043543.1 hypothetical protein [Shinella fusca]